MTTKMNQYLLAHCITKSRKLKEDLIHILNHYEIGFVPLIVEKIGLSVSLPLKLSGTASNLLIEDTNGTCFSLQLLKNIVVLRKFNVAYEVSYFFEQGCDFSLVKIVADFENGTSLIIDTNEFIDLNGISGESLSIIFYETIVTNLNINFLEIFDLCVETLIRYNNNIDISKIENYLEGHNCYDYAILKTSKENQNVPKETA